MSSISLLCLPAPLCHDLLMRQIMTYLAVGALAACASSPPPSTSEQANICEIFEGRKDWYRAAAKAQRTWGTSIPLQMAIIKAESNFKKDARPPRGKRRNLGLTKGRRPSSARGFTQALDGTWNEYKQQTGNRSASRKDFSDATDFIGWYTSSASKAAGIGINDARSQYLAYHEGARGYRRGTWRSKQWLINKAELVNHHTEAFKGQLPSCERRLKKRGLFG